MNTFPTTLTPLQTSTRTSQLKLIMSGFENGTGQAQRRSTRDTYLYKLDFVGESWANYMTYEDFFNANKGDTVMYTDSWDSTTRYVKMVGDTIEANTSNGKSSPAFSIQLVEI